MHCCALAPCSSHYNLQTTDAAEHRVRLRGNIKPSLYWFVVRIKDENSWHGQAMHFRVEKQKRQCQDVTILQTLHDCSNRETITGKVRVSELCIFVYFLKAYIWANNHYMLSLSVALLWCSRGKDLHIQESFFHFFQQTQTFQSVVQPKESSECSCSRVQLQIQYFHNKEVEHTHSNPAPSFSSSLMAEVSIQKDAGGHEWPVWGGIAGFLSCLNPDIT